MLPVGHAGRARHRQPTRPGVGRVSAGCRPGVGRAPVRPVRRGPGRIYRVHVPGIRILYEIDEDTATVYVINIAVTV